MRYTPSSTLEIKIADSELIRVIGRHTVTEDGMLALDWCSSGFSFIFNGRGFNISFGAFNAFRHSAYRKQGSKHAKAKNYSKNLFHKLVLLIRFFGSIQHMPQAPFLTQ